MKNYYKISEISKLYGIGTDSLRYYERLGILKPRRDTNGYRLYSLNDMYKLNLIRDLRLLHFSMSQIKDYLDGQSIENTLDLFAQERDFLSQQIHELTQRREALGRRIRSIKRDARIEEGRPRLLDLTSRPCVRISEHITRDEEMDFLIQKLQRQHEDVLRDFGSLSVGAFFAQQELAQGKTNVYESVFLLLDRPGEEDFSLSQGLYLSCFYRGAYEQNGERVRQLTAFAEDKGLALLGSPFEIYHIDNRHTAEPQEFLTELQIQAELPRGTESKAPVFREKLW